MPTAYTILLYVLGIAISWIIFYYVVKAAVRNGIRESHLDNEKTRFVKQDPVERVANAEQLKLQQRYEQGKMTLEEYRAEWNKLNR